MTRNQAKQPENLGQQSRLQQGRRTDVQPVSGKLVRGLERFEKPHLPTVNPQRIAVSEAPDNCLMSNSVCNVSSKGLQRHFNERQQINSDRLLTFQFIDDGVDVVLQGAENVSIAPHNISLQLHKNTRSSTKRRLSSRQHVNQPADFTLGNFAPRPNRRIVGRGAK